MWGEMRPDRRDCCLRGIDRCTGSTLHAELPLLTWNPVESKPLPHAARSKTSNVSQSTRVKRWATSCTALLQFLLLPVL